MCSTQHPASLRFVLVENNFNFYDAAVFLTCFAWKSLKINIFRYIFKNCNLGHTLKCHLTIWLRRRDLLLLDKNHLPSLDSKLSPPVSD